MCEDAAWWEIKGYKNYYTVFCGVSCVLLMMHLLIWVHFKNLKNLHGVPISPRFSPKKLRTFLLPLMNFKPIYTRLHMTIKYSKSKQKIPFTNRLSIEKDPFRTYKQRASVHKLLTTITRREPTTN